MVLNSILLLILCIICYSSVVICSYFFDKEGIFVWICVATVVSNITAASIGPMLGIHGVTLANVPFATVFLSTQILSTLYSKEDGFKGVYLSLFSSVIFLAVMMVCSYLVPEPYDSVTSHLNFLFSFGSYNMCNTIASVLMFFLANLSNVFLFNKLKAAFNNKNLWLANNISTIICNCIENFAFVSLGLYLFPNIVFYLFPNCFDVSNLIPFSSCMQVALTTCIFEFILAIFDTPFLYLSLHLNKNKLNVNKNKLNINN